MMSYTQDPVFQTIQQIRTPQIVEEVFSQVWSRWSSHHLYSVKVTPSLTNYKPYERARVMAEATIVLADDNNSSVTLNLFFHVFAKAEIARQEFENSYTHNFLPCQGPPVFFIPHWQTVVWTLPNAPNLRELEQLLQPKKFCHFLVPPEQIPSGIEDCPTPKLLRYVPLKRAILAWENPKTHRRYFAKLLNATDAPHVVRNFQQVDAAFASGELGFSVPEFVSYNPAVRTLLMTEVLGTQFTEVMHRVIPESFSLVGQNLARLHDCNLHPETIWTPSKELAVLHRHMKGLKLALPHLTAQLEGVISRLEDLSERLPFLENYSIHGNLFGDQILYRPNGIGIVDWDALSIGDPLYDLGRLIAHLIYIAGREKISPPAVNACVEALLRAYEQETNRLIDHSCLVWHIATQLLLRGKISSLRKLVEGWQADLDFVVNESERVLDGQSLYLSLPTLNHSVLSEV
jgi:hypothetical protein